MKYDEALKRWGAMKLATWNRMGIDAVDLETVRVDFTFDEGYACCGGSNPDCYCSFAESPSAKVEINGRGLGDRKRLYSWSMNVEEFDFATVLRELCEAGDGMIVAE